MSRAKMHKRLAIRGWDQSRPWIPFTKMLTTKTYGTGHNPGTTAGAQWDIPINNWNDPLGDGGTFVAGTGILITNRHPLNHSEALSDGYTVAQVLSAKIEVTPKWNIASDDVDGDYFLAWAFSKDSAAPVTLAVGGAVEGEIGNIKSDPRWEWRRYSSSQETRDQRRKATVITIPNMFDYCEIVGRGDAVDGIDSITAGNVSHLLADVAFNSGPPDITLFVHLVVVMESGLAMAINSVSMEVLVTQKVRLMHDATAAGLNRTPDAHP